MVKFIFEYVLNTDLQMTDCQIYRFTDDIFTDLQMTDLQIYRPQMTYFSHF